jgi:hypothetical protein
MFITVYNIQLPHLSSVFGRQSFQKVKYPRSFDHFGFIWPFYFLQALIVWYLSLSCPENHQKRCFWVKNECFLIVPKFGWVSRYCYTVHDSELPGHKCIPLQRNKPAYQVPERPESSYTTLIHSQFIFFRVSLYRTHSYSKKFEWNMARM